MNNRKILYEIHIIIEYLKNNEDYNYKLYNSSYSDIGNITTSIIEYAEDIENYLTSILENEDKGEFIILEICKIFFDNLQLLQLDDEKSKKLKEYIYNHYDDGIKTTPSEDIKELYKEALLDLLDADYIYDFRE